MLRHLSAAALAAALVGSQTPAHAETREERLAAAFLYVVLAVDDMVVDDVIRQIAASIVAEIEATGARVTPEQVAEFESLLQAEMHSPMLDILLAQDQIMADVLTLEEIEALAEFYGSPAGRSVMRKLPEVVARQQPQIMAMVQGTIPGLMPEISRIFGLQ
ncbi:MAG: DUF2059 domain-containing protein [Gemmobacter sp.]